MSHQRPRSSTRRTPSEKPLLWQHYLLNSAARNKREKKQLTVKADKQTKQIKQVQTNGTNKTFYYGLIMLILCFKFKAHLIESQGKKSVKIRVRFHRSDSAVLEELLLIGTPPPHLTAVSNY